ncbi:vacuolar protein sorting-associated protein 72 homolog [Centruroides sculpturatus]|uniref:vacuolar protein sorting-associated protein 72 homolog n=1 Tax=Centruroides sculpturatus TaxID=218467 RepID=UPI000C6D4C6C|nr:vacuolar protein sorting-associated protein 72 homolog [Centruroides sculpturatus]XP_023224394.1 vacuolar protein sorting-associated protein 72 homolog [Centruroides sculpturatus]XP_023224395.1 vacuolar protein sorting-associated protein 72 homolog [Centruroides sculpturatus]
MAADRDKRVNAGSRMARLLDEEEEDEFYKTTYGGFYDVESDNAYETEDEESDVYDSDFSIDENDEPVSDQDEDEQKQRRRTTTKFYKEPKRDTSKKQKDSRIPKCAVKPVISDVSVERKSVRQSTKEKSEQTERRMKQQEELKKNREPKKRDSSRYYRMTQEELLAEAKITEQKNLKSLESYQRLELEKKKTKIIKPAYKGPMIRYHSVSMPLIEELSEQENGTTEKKPTEQRCSRNFVTFTDEKLLREYFPNRKPKPASRTLCPITKMPSRYFDPVTLIPYANLQAFRFLREAYYQQLEQKGDMRQPDVAAWVEWRKKNKPASKQTAVKTTMSVKPTKES